MSMTLEQISHEVLSLPREERAQLLDQLTESLGPTDDLHRAVWAAEALRRRDEARSGAVETISGDQALARVRRAVGQ